MGERTEKCVSSADNPVLKSAKKLFRDRDYRREAGAFMIEGYRVFDSAADVRTILLRGEARLPEGDFGSAAILRVAEGVFDKISPDGPGQGVFGICGLPAPGSLSEKGRYVYLDALQDPGNVGTIVRTAAAFALDGVVVGRGTADPFAPKAARSAAGAVFRVPLILDCTVESITGRPLIAADADGIPLGDLGRKDSFVLAIGNEGAGVSRVILDACDAKVSVPMAGGTESLNAAVAAGIILYGLVSGGG